MQKLEDFILSVRPAYPLSTYLEWFSNQDGNTFKVNFGMWRWLYRDYIDLMMPIIEEETHQEDIGDTETFLHMCFIVFWYHFEKDKETKVVIESLIDEVNHEH